MDKLIRYLGTLDWVVAVCTLLAGLYFRNWWVVASGVFGVGIAYYQPAVRVKALLEKKFLRKMKPGELATSQVQQDEAFYAQVLGDENPAEAVEPVQPRTPRTYASAPIPYRGTFVGRRKHNMLKVEHFNMFNGGDGGATHY
ncbi:hypothetical protein [Burkholderia cenocepacia]|uniref:hypothetical protein n=1 Tax=Burkholderia cenocepacia TaxID=95486 RepID=UPI00076218F3|nr:hypothetical protein [Burkholderia cenocepacia]KWU24752.1 hypothetical protein AS149_31910 [Burkholderia cenocepacia]